MTVISLNRNQNSRVIFFFNINHIISMTSQALESSTWLASDSVSKTQT